MLRNKGMAGWMLDCSAFTQRSVFAYLCILRRRERKSRKVARMVTSCGQSLFREHKIFLADRHAYVSSNFHTRPGRRGCVRHSCGVEGRVHAGVMVWQAKLPGGLLPWPGTSSERRRESISWVREGMKTKHTHPSCQVSRAQVDMSPASTEGRQVTQPPNLGP